MTSIICDTREQKPLFNKVEAIHFKLLVGDYSTMLLRDSFCIERKSLQDLYGSIIQGHVRFRKESIRAVANDIKLVIYVEGTRLQFINKRFPRGGDRKISGETLSKIISSIEKRWKVEIVWCQSRTQAKKLILERLRKEEISYGKSTQRGRIEEAPRKGGKAAKQKAVDGVPKRNASNGSNDFSVHASKVAATKIKRKVRQ